MRAGKYTLLATKSLETFSGLGMEAMLHVGSNAPLLLREWI